MLSRGGGWHHAPVTRQTLIRVALGAVLLLALTAFKPPPDSGYDALITAALQARKAGDATRTLELLQQAYAIKPSPQLLNNVASTLVELGRYREAHEAFNKVANDPTASTDLRGLDAARAGSLLDRLGKAWVVARPDPPDANVLVDGDTPGVANGTEFPARPGKRTFEYVTADGLTAALRIHNLPADRRTTLSDKLVMAGDAQLMIAGVQRLEIDGYRVASDLRKLTTVRLPAGVHTLTATLDGKSRTKDVTLPAGQVQLAELLPAPKPTPIVAPVIRKRSSGALRWVGPITTAAVGAGLLGVGAWLTVDAETQRDKVREGETIEGVLQLTRGEANQIQDDADQSATVGAVLLSTGGAAMLGAVLWVTVLALSDDDTASAPRIVPTRHGLAIGGRF